ncbi:MAG: hypothetical protein ACTHK3_03315 [Solirubrobacterales bacterium]
MDAARGPPASSSSTPKIRFIRAYIIHREVAADLVVRALERRAAEREEEAKETLLREESAEGAAQRTAATRPRGAHREGRALTPGEGQDRRRARGSLQRRSRAKAPRTALGRKSKHDLARFRIVAKLFLEDNPSLAGCGLRFTLEKLRDVKRNR